MLLIKHKRTCLKSSLRFTDNNVVCSTILATLILFKHWLKVPFHIYRNKFAKTVTKSQTSWLHLVDNRQNFDKWFRQKPQKRNPLLYPPFGEKHKLFPGVALFCYEGNGTILLTCGVYVLVWVFRWLIPHKSITNHGDWNASSMKLLYWNNELKGCKMLREECFLLSFKPIFLR